jgi:hypothetical protein
VSFGERGGDVAQNGYWYSKETCPECNEARLAFAVRRDGSTFYLLCENCGANYDAPPQPDEHNPDFDTPVEELKDPPRWASREEIEHRGWGGSVAGHCKDGT